jgi:hypothetical protein
MPDVKQVTVIVANPSSRDPVDQGRVTIGYYLLEGDRLTMTDGEGGPVRGKSGERITHKLEAGEDAAIIAKRLTMKIYRMVWGDGMAGFNRPLHYRPLGIA